MLLLASAINYMDRQTLANTSVRITEEFGMSQEQYGNLEAGFGWAFAVGSLFFGFLADRVSLRWLYAAVLVLWSAMGFASGFVQDYDQLLLCRTLLGFFEAGHWPCGIKTVRAILDSQGRAMGNGVLQSGTSIGAIVTPLIMRWMLTDDVGSWRLPFQVVGAIGIFWAVAWLIVTRGDSLRTRICPGARVVGRLVARAARSAHVRHPRRHRADQHDVSDPSRLAAEVPARRPRLRQSRKRCTSTPSGSAPPTSGASARARSRCGSRGAGNRSLTARMVTFFRLCADGPGDRLRSLVAGKLAAAGRAADCRSGALGVFPIYHAFTQDLSQQHQGKGDRRRRRGGVGLFAVGSTTLWPPYR